MASPRPSPTLKLRLQRYLAACGAGSRRACEDLIREGRVSVNGSLVTEMGVTVEPGQDTVCLDGRTVEPQRRVYLAVHKPLGVLCTSRDPQGRRTVLDLLPAYGERLYTIGRLDADSEGLILVTNDGDLAHLLMHPRHHVHKVYEVWSSKPMAATQQRRMTDGLWIDGEAMRMVSLRESSRDAQGVRYRVVLAEGKKRQIRRMFREAGCKVVRLIRTHLGSVSLGNLAVGQHRPLTAAEVEQLRKDAQARDDDRARPGREGPWRATTT